jgi:pimeloyl-ACP methyl ester carboxylesterase
MEDAMTETKLAGKTRTFTLQGKAGKLAALEKWPVGDPKGLALLVHGATYTGMSAFDFHFPGGEDYSLIDYLVGRGFACVTFGIRGYGASEPVEDGLAVTTSAAMEDALTVADWIRDTYGRGKTHVLGWSWGGRITSRFAEAYPDRVERLVLFAPSLTTERNWDRPGISGSHRDNTIESTIVRIEPALADPDARMAFASHVVANEPRSPNGVFYEEPSPGKPENITCPTLMIFGAADGIYRLAEAPNYFARIANDDKALVLIPGAGHFMFLQHPRRRFFRIVADFLGD